MHITFYLSSMSLLCSLGDNHRDVFLRLLDGDASFMEHPAGYDDKKFLLGTIKENLPHNSFSTLQCNKIIASCFDSLKDDVEKLKELYGKERIGIVLGSSNGGIKETYENMQDYFSNNDACLNLASLEVGSASEFLARWADVTGPAYTLSTACSSSAKAMKSAINLIKYGLCDAVIAGGTDSLCSFAINGFDALEALSSEHTIPFSANRAGINIGEGGALFLVTSKDFGTESIKLLGVGESSDAYHMTSPDPEGKGAQMAIQTALNNAQIAPETIDYINLHGTGTHHNDSMESKVVANIFASKTPCSSTKPLTGHTLGACGALELAFCWLTLSSLNTEKKLPMHVWDNEQDTNLPPLEFVQKGQTADRLDCCASLSFAFGGSNTCVVIGK